MIRQRIPFRKLATVSSCLLVTASCFGQARKFNFGQDPPVSGYELVSPQQRYDSKTGCGFDLSSNVQLVSRKKGKGLRKGFVTSNQPFYFSVALPEGNYHVKVLLGDQEGESVTTIKAECRRLMVEKIHTPKGAFAIAEFNVHIHDSLIKGEARGVRLKPRETNYLHWDNKLTLEFNGAQPKVCAVEISPAQDVTTVFLAGNSTVVDQAEEPWAAWGQMIPAFFKPEGVVVGNYAESGETLKAFKGERRLEKLWSMSKPGDFLFIEFAHNDQKPGGSHLDPFTTYKQTLKEWIAEARSRGIHPVLVTSMHRRSFDAEGHIVNTLSDYPEAMRQTAKEEQVPLIDLNAMSKVLYEAWGPAASLRAFVHYPANTFPGQTAELKDDTHFNSYGAYELAQCVANGIREAKLPIARYLRDDMPVFDPAHPDPVDQFSLPASAFQPTRKPDGN
jgi:lysophospholipase L1-like esterase